MILTGRVGMEGPSDEEEEEGTEIVGRSRELEEAKVLSMRTGGASDLKKKKRKSEDSRHAGPSFPSLWCGRQVAFLSRLHKNHNGNHV